MAVIFLIFVSATKTLNRGKILLRACVALVIAVFLAHFNRIFHVDPAHLNFPSGHMTFCLGVSISLALLQPWTLSVTLPFLLIFGIDLVHYRCHTTADVIGAIGLVVVVYGIVHVLWPITRASPPLDRAMVSL